MKILIVDDEVVSLTKMDRLLQGLGYETLMATDGAEGWKIWKEERVRIVITDWMMPGIDGLELCSRIKNAEGSRYTYVIMVTQKENTHDIVTAMDAGADDFITKPYVKAELAVRIRAGERVLSLESRDVVIFSLAKLAESRDPETGNHLERIRFYSKELAEVIGRSDSTQEIDRLFIDNIFLTSPLHDIGKVGIPDAILLKPGKFNNEEFEIMKTHSRIGFDTINEAYKKYPKADYLKMSAEIALSHHEKFNGAGYPDGLSGNDIPLAARIVALSDVYDALVNKRVYKDRFTHDMAKSIIIKDKGTHFDPMVVDAFLSREERFIEIFKQFDDG
ncbi:MAG: response regulator [Desulfobulbaceae bacterium]|nr:response regulator [Desulfobulbaceae bacterium]